MFLYYTAMGASSGHGGLGEPGSLGGSNSAEGSPAGDGGGVAGGNI